MIPSARTTRGQTIPYLQYNPLPRKYSLQKEEKKLPPGCIFGTRKKKKKVTYVGGSRNIVGVNDLIRGIYWSGGKQ